MKTQIYYEITDGSGCIGKHGTYSFKSAKEAIRVATEFKNNPLSHNENMTDENVKYWSNRDYTIVRCIVTTEEIKTV